MPASEFPAKQTFWVAVLLIASRPIGLLREIVFAWKLGVSPQTDAFFAAFALIEVTTDAIATGFLACAIIPVFAQLCQSDRTRSEAWRAASLSLNCFGLLALAIMVVGEIFAPSAIAGLFPGFSAATAGTAAAALRWLLPYFVLQILATVLVGVLQSLGDFILVATVQLLQNVVIIGCVLLLSARMGVFSAALGMVFFGLLQFLIFGKRLLREIPTYTLFLSFRDPLLRTTLRLGAFTFLATLLLDAGYLISRYFGSSLAEGAVSALTYAVRFKYVAVAAAAFPLATTLFPSMAQSASDGSGQRDILLRAIRLCLVITLPIVILLLVEREAIVALAYQRGAFTAEMAKYTAAALAGYAIGIVPYGLCLLFQRYFVAGHRTAPAVVAFGVEVAVIYALTPWLARTHGIFGITLAYSLGEIAAMISFLFQLTAADREVIVAGIGTQAIRSAAPVIAATAILLAVPRMISSLPPKGFSLLLWETLRVAASLTAYATIMWVLPTGGSALFVRRPRSDTSS